MSEKLTKVEFTNLDKTDEIEMWAKKTKDFLKEADEVFGYFSKYNSGNPTSDAEQLIKLLS